MLKSGSEFKITNNIGEILSRTNMSEDKEQQYLAFTHWFVESTEGKIAVADLRGIGDTLMDPTLITGSTKLDRHCDLFCNANFKEGAIKKLISGHTCNDICHQMGLKACDGWNNPYNTDDQSVLEISKINKISNISKN